MKPSETLLEYLHTRILPLYDSFDAAHSRTHALDVMAESLRLAEHYDVNVDMVAAAAAFHDVGLAHGRAEHHTHSARIIREDEFLRRYFTPEQVDIIADAAEDHRASSTRAPRTIYGRIIAEADRQILPEVVLRRTVQYGLEHYPELSPEGHYARFCNHLHEKYGRTGYLRLWIDESHNATALEQLRKLIDNEPLLHKTFLRIFNEV
ncbi:MAG: HD domain-containing protein [Rikenellaceae bacterium]|nr:HD domain-containing protein [Rikenellaceae bacterium]